MKKTETLNKNRDFLRAYKSGVYSASDLLVCYTVKNRSGCVRYGLTASKKVGNAVGRNRARRLMRTAFLQLLPNLPSGCDYVFVARDKTKTSCLAPVLRDMDKLLGRNLSQLRKKGIIS